MAVVTKNNLREVIKGGLSNNYSHCIIVYDKWDGDFYPIYVKYGDNPTIIAKEINNDESNMLIVKEIYSYELDIEKQLNEVLAYHSDSKILSDELVEKALDFATEKHKGQYRKGDNPVEYITHPIEVSKLVEYYNNENKELNDLKAAAYLHDTVEDTNTSLEEIESLFGKKVASLVDELTTDEDKARSIGKVAYLSNKMTNMTNSALTIKLCDRLHNVSELPYSNDEEFIEEYLEETSNILDNIANQRKYSDIQLAIINDLYNTIDKVKSNNNEKRLVK
ncbi:MAG: bifunctional (p)ppGpp synthetase/guanosine-3',5'-bis(diphosphate) 3'-pyrophosphohydrolase [Bacilli bacterium]|nr:bifunctional (p)ppGpp synthetase/guanosine-3',5'-bis(diphosphate) 3'-pyrophosphohydrolase [Bacilli bacterium]